MITYISLLFYCFSFFYSAVNKKPGVLYMRGEHSQLNCILSSVLRFNNNIVYKRIHHQTTGQGLSHTEHPHIHRSEQAAPLSKSEHLFGGLSALFPTTVSWCIPSTFDLCTNAAMQFVLLSAAHLHSALRGSFRLLQLVTCNLCFTLTNFPVVWTGYYIFIHPIFWWL